ncbi:chemotaxis protein CheA [Aureimonas glaciei]|uniref:Chemotaxis protein CheA n=1 Tax=Aureimonas glaciei TaxID=1776957 RepID=A0A916YFS1_9HYPH|nr:chemotaxis protein CheA [Aureimonas glaciei]GGD41585.1 chemotaxis protein CheA [Aureimonas glaciei]
MNPLLAQFIPEARDLLDQAGAGMLVLERNASSDTAVNDVFRAVHTLKGSSGLFDVGPLTRLVHAAEDLLGEVRLGHLSVTGEIIDQLLESLDLVGSWIDALEQRHVLPGDAEAEMAKRVALLRHWLSETEPNAAAPAELAPHLRLPPDWLVHFPEETRAALYCNRTSENLLAWSFEPDEGCFFRGDDPVAMVRQSPGLLAVRVLPRDGAFPDFESWDPLTSVLRFEILSDASRATIDEHMRYVAEMVEIREIGFADLAIPTGRRAGGPVFADFGSIARAHLAKGDLPALRNAASTLLGMVAPACLQAAALRWCLVLTQEPESTDLDALARMTEAAATGELPPKREADLVAEGPPATSPPRAGAVQPDHALCARLAREQATVLETPPAPGIAQGRLEAVAKVLTHLGRATGRPVDAAVAEAMAAQARSGDLSGLHAIAARLADPTATADPSEPVVEAKPAAAAFAAAAVAPAPAPSGDEPAPAAAAGDGKAIARVLRIDQAKIDSIMNFVAELIVAKNGLSYLATRAEHVHGARAVAREIKEHFAVIDRITQDLQVGIMSVRMMPVGQVFQRFPRLVRDISRKLDKKINLVIEGEDTEADKNVLESLADPLIHMVRNSLDHGIETPEDRRAAGKSEAGTLKITARHEGDFVVIEVRDDGKGIDPETVKQKACDLGLITAERSAQMSDEEACNLVFAAGFSTKEEISDLSGRGVGMDVVRSAVVKAGGDVALRSTLGVGTSVIVRLPLTMAVTQIVTIDCCGRLFGVPMDQVVETVRVARSQIHRLKTMETFVLRDTIIPMARLRSLMNLVPLEEEAVPTEEAVMVAQVGGERVGVVVDGFRERMEVIVKPLEGVLEGMAGFSGTTLLGDGQVLLILDLQEML